VIERKGANNRENMPLESTMIWYVRMKLVIFTMLTFHSFASLDNSEWMRNGDYVPTRLAAQQDAASMLSNHRLNDNPESTVGILSMAGQGVDLLVSPTEESSKVLACFSKVKISGTTDLTTSIQIAQLALKHRKNKNGGQRIVVFLGGPVTESIEVLQKLGKQLKKNNVALDVISIGETEENTPKLEELINATNTTNNRL
jgi:26S proteasome regulatory subunit N10